MKSSWEKYLIEKDAIKYSLIIKESNEYITEDFKTLFTNPDNIKKILNIISSKNLESDLKNNSELAHFTLDAAGVIPGIGEVADGLNAIWYIKEKQWFNAALSIISLLPIAGDIIGKGTKYLAKGNKGIARFVAKYGDDIAKIWKKFTSNPKMLKNNFKKIVNAVGGEQKFDNAVSNMTKEVSNVLKKKEVSDKKAEGILSKILKNPELQKMVLNKLLKNNKLEEIQNSYDGIKIPEYGYRGYDTIEEKYDIDAINKGKKNWKIYKESKHVILENDNVQKAYSQYFMPAFNILNKSNPSLKDGVLAMDYLKKSAYIINAEGNKTHQYATFDTIEIGKWSTIIDKINQIIRKTYIDINSLRQSIAEERNFKRKEQKNMILLYMENAVRTIKSEIKVLISEMGDHIDSRSDELNKKELERQNCIEDEEDLNNLEITI